MPDINNSADNVINQLGRIISGNTDTAQSLGVRLENAKADLDNAWTALSRPWSGQKEYDELTDRIAKMDMEIKGRPAQQQDDMEDGMQADLAEATFRSNGQEALKPRTTRHTRPIFPPWTWTNRKFRSRTLRRPRQRHAGRAGPQHVTSSMRPKA